MLKTTEKLLKAFADNDIRFCRVREIESPGDSEIIYLDGDFALVIDEDDALPSIALMELMAIGGNVETERWIINDDAVINEAAAIASHYCKPF